MIRIRQMEKKAMTYEKSSKNTHIRTFRLKNEIFDHLKKTLITLSFTKCSYLNDIE